MRAHIKGAVAVACGLSVGVGCGHVQTTIDRETTSTRESWRPEVLPSPTGARVYDHLEVVTHDAVRTFDDAVYAQEDGVLKVRRRGEKADLMLADIALSEVEVIRGTHIQSEEQRHVKGSASGWPVAGITIAVSFLLFLGTAL